MCEENIQVTVESRPRYHVSANKSSYVSAAFDSIEEAAAEASRLALEGYDVVSIRDNKADSDLW